MGVRTFKRYSDEYRLALVREIEGGKSVPEVERASDVPRTTLYRWVEELSTRTLGIGEVKAVTGQDPGTGEGSGVGVRKRKMFSEEVKRAAVRAVKGGRKVPELAKELGVDKGALYRWCKEFASAEERPGSREIEGVGDVALGRAKVESIADVQANLRTEREAKEFERQEQGRAAQEEKERVQAMVADPLSWLQLHTQTKDSHWREAGASSAYRPFPEKPYFRPIVETFQAEPVVFIEKSRDMMLSWLCVGLFTHAAMTIEGIEVLFQSQNEDKAFELVQYAKTLYSRQKPEIQKAFPLARSLRYMADGELAFAHGSRIIGIPGGGDQIRSYHPWGLFQDEAAFMPEAGEAYDNAVPVCQKIVVLSSAGPGWFAEVCASAG